MTYYIGDLLNGWLITSYCMGSLPCITDILYMTDLSVMHLVTIFILVFFFRLLGYIAERSQHKDRWVGSLQKSSIPGMLTDPQSGGFQVC